MKLRGIVSAAAILRGKSRISYDTARQARQQARPPLIQIPTHLRARNDTHAHTRTHTHGAHAHAFTRAPPPRPHTWGACGFHTRVLTHVRRCAAAPPPALDPARLPLLPLYSTASSSPPFLHVLVDNKKPGRDARSAATNGGEFVTGSFPSASAPRAGR